MTYKILLQRRIEIARQAKSMIHSNMALRAIVAIIEDCSVTERIGRAFMSGLDSRSEEEKLLMLKATYHVQEALGALDRLGRKDVTHDLIVMDAAVVADMRATVAAAEAELILNRIPTQE